MARLKVYKLLGFYSPFLPWHTHYHCPKHKEWLEFSGWRILLWFIWSLLGRSGGRKRMPEIPAKPKWLMKRKEGGLKVDAWLYGRQKCGTHTRLDWFLWQMFYINWGQWGYLSDHVGSEQGHAWYPWPA